MRIGIVVYSKTGNTLAVASLLKDKLIKNNNNVEIEMIEISGDSTQGMGHFEITKSPDITNYDFLVFGAPVNAFALCPVMLVFLNQISISGLTNKRVACLVTQHFAYPWLGGNRAIAQMKKICEEKDGTVVATGIINWSKKTRNQQIETVVNNIFNAINKI